MARYFFDIADSETDAPSGDPVDVHDVREQGMRALVKIMNETQHGGPPREFSFMMCDETGRQHIRVTVKMERLGKPTRLSSQVH